MSVGAAIMVTMRPMLASHTAVVPRGDDWVHEIKWDGWRIITEIRHGATHLTTRSGRDVTAAFPELGGLRLPDLVLDGELIAFDESGRPSLHALAERIPGGRGRVRTSRTVAMMLFDVLRLDGHDLTTEPWHRRRELLEALAPSIEHDRWTVPDTHDDGEDLLRITAETGLEGVVSKRRDSLYRPGERSPDWLKRPHRLTRSVVVGGWRPETGSRHRLGAVLVGVPTNGGLRMLGRVGSGLGGRTGDDLLPHLRALSCKGNPFVEVPAEDAKDARWVRPELVVDVESLGTGSQGRLRQPAFRGVRTDLTPDDVAEEAEDAG